MSGGQDPAAMQTDHKEKDTDVASGISSRHRLLNGNSFMYDVQYRQLSACGFWCWEILCLIISSDS